MHTKRTSKYSPISKRVCVYSTNIACEHMKYEYRFQTYCNGCIWFVKCSQCVHGFCVFWNESWNRSHWESIHSKNVINCTANVPILFRSYNQMESVRCNQFDENLHYFGGIIKISIPVDREKNMFVKHRIEMPHLWNSCENAWNWWNRLSEVNVFH